MCRVANTKYIYFYEICVWRSSERQKGYRLSLYSRSPLNQFLPYLKKGTWSTPRQRAKAGTTCTTAKTISCAFEKFNISCRSSYVLLSPTTMFHLAPLTSPLPIRDGNRYKYLGKGWNLPRHFIFTSLWKAHYEGHRQFHVGSYI